MNLSTTEIHPRNLPCRAALHPSALILHPFPAPRSPQTPSLPGTDPRSDRPRCDGRESKFLAGKFLAGGRQAGRQAGRRNVLPHDEPDRPRTRELEHDGVDPRQMIRQQQEAPFRQRPHPMRRHPVDEPPDERADSSDEAFGEGRGAIHGAGVFDFSAR